MHTSIAELTDAAMSRSLTIGAAVREQEALDSGESQDALNSKMQERLAVMRDSVGCGLAGVRSRSGLTGGDARRMAEARTWTRTMARTGAAGGCQAECGAAAAMAAAAAVQIAGGAPEQCANGVALAFKGLLGLVCDPVAGLVEVPCIKRNATSVAVALAAADMALAGIRSVIPADEVIQAMGAIGRELPASLRETAFGGLAIAPTGKRIASEINVVHDDSWR